MSQTLDLTGRQPPQLMSSTPPGEPVFQLSSVAMLATVWTVTKPALQHAAQMPRRRGALHLTFLIRPCQQSQSRVVVSTAETGESVLMGQSLVQVAAQGQEEEAV